MPHVHLICEHETDVPWNGRLDQRFPNTRLSLSTSTGRQSYLGQFRFNIVTGPKQAVSGREWHTAQETTQMQGHKGWEFLIAKQKVFNKQSKKEITLEKPEMHSNPRFNHAL